MYHGTGRSDGCRCARSYRSRTASGRRAVTAHVIYCCGDLPRGVVPTANDWTEGADRVHRAVELGATHHQLLGGEPYKPTVSHTKDITDVMWWCCHKALTKTGCVLGNQRRNIALGDDQLHNRCTFLKVYEWSETSSFLREGLSEAGSAS